MFSVTVVFLIDGHLMVDYQHFDFNDHLFCVCVCVKNKSLFYLFRSILYFNTFAVVVVVVNKKCYKIYKENKNNLIF